MRKLVTLIFSTVLTLFALAACGSDSDNKTDQSSMTAMSMQSKTGSADAVKDEIVISGFAYVVPESFTPGQKVTIRNNDSVEHSVTSDTKGTFSTDVEGGETATLTLPDQPGTYTFYCTYHPTMHGTLVVK